MTRLLPLLLMGCAGFRPIDPQQPCLEAGYAIAATTERCTGDRALANQRYESFASQYTCIDRVPSEDSWPAEDLYDCAFSIELLPCEVAAEFGDDLARYLSMSPACALVTQKKEAR